MRDEEFLAQEIDSVFHEGFYYMSLDTSIS